MKKLAGSFILLVFVFLYAQNASAVTGNGEITVTSSGRPLPGTTVSLISKETGTTITSTETNSSGIATITADEGTYIVEVGEGEDKTQTEIIITGGQTSSVTVELPLIHTPPPFTHPPMISFTYGNEQTDDFPVTRTEDRITDVVNGNQLPTEVNPGDANDINNRFDFELDWNQTAGTFGTGIGHSEKFHPSVHVTAGRADVSFRNHNLADPTRTRLFEGDGFLFGAGGDVMLIHGNVFGGGGYCYTGYHGVELTRNIALTAPGGVITRDDIEVDYNSHQIRGYVGYIFGPVYPYGGVVFWSRDMEITGVMEADFSQSAGFPVIRTVEFTNQFDDDTAAGFIGTMIRVGHFIGGVEATFGGDFTTVRVNAGVGF
jgi:hypothetical protein